MDHTHNSTLFSTMNVSKEDTALAPMTAQEEKELLRVFNLLTNFHLKYKIKLEIAELDVWITSSKLQVQHPETSAINLLTGNINSAEDMMIKTEKRLNELKAELNAIESKADQKIIVQDILEMHKFLKKKISKFDADEMLWEVDEDLDQAINWNEFKLMFNRNITDKSGLEPSRMVSRLIFFTGILSKICFLQFNLAQYLMYDHNQSGKVSVDGTMHMLYARLVVQQFLVFYSKNELIFADMVERKWNRS